MRFAHSQRAAGWVGRRARLGLMGESDEVRFAADLYRGTAEYYDRYRDRKSVV